MNVVVPTVFLVFHYSISLVTIPLEICCIYIVYSTTRKSQPLITLLLVEIVGWNCAANVLWTLFPFYPNVTNRCFYTTGLIGGTITTSPFITSLFFDAVIVLFFYVAIGCANSFFFKWFVLIFPDRLKQLSHIWAYTVVFLQHVGVTALYLWVSRKIYVFPPTAIFCMTSTNDQFIPVLIFFAISLGCNIGICVTFTLWTYLALNKNSGEFSATTKKLQKATLRNLVLLALSTMCAGVIPAILMYVFFYFQTPFLQIPCLFFLFVYKLMELFILLFV